MKKSEIEMLQQYVAEIDRFAELLRGSQETIADLERELAVKKQEYDDARAAVKEAKEVEHSTVTLLLKFVRPGSLEVLPLFDTMEPSDDTEHGRGSTEWRKEPIAVLSLSAAALRALVAADVVLVGQIQDRLLGDPEKWYEVIDGVSPGMAEAIAAKFHAYVEERTGDE
jgi:hypothetical protein